jgi:SAM-dependent methyltransferase
MNTHEDRWRSIYKLRQYETHYPFDEVVSFVFRYCPKDRPPDSIKILDLGCGLGNNLRFLASAGFAATGIDISEEAVSRCKQMLQLHNYKADVLCCSCAELPFSDAYFDMVVDRGTFTVLPDGTFETAFAEVRRVLRPAGHFLFTPYSDVHSSNGLLDSLSDGLVLPITGGSLIVRDRGVRFLSVNEVRSLFRNGWVLKSVYLKQLTEMLEPMRLVDAWWNVVAEKA